MSIKSRCFLGAGVVAVALLSSQPGFAKTLRFSVSAPPDTVWDMQTIRYVKNVAEISKGSLKIDAYGNSQLGSEQDVLQQVARGRIDMGGFAVSSTTIITPEIGLLNLPFLFESSKQQDCVFGKMAAPTEKLLAKKNLQFLSWTHIGETNLVGKKPFLTPADVKGLRARSQLSKTASLMWTTIGASPIPLPITEWTTAHQTGMVDLSEAPVAYYFYSGLGEIATIMTKTRHVEQVGVALMNMQTWEKLSEDDRNVLIKAGERAPLSMLRDEIRAFEADIAETHEMLGGEIVELTVGQRAVWRETMSVMWPKAVEEIGQGASAYWGQIQTAVKACPNTSLP